MMANELNIQLNPFTETGLTLLGKVYDKTGAQVGSNVSMSDSNSVALYTGDFSLGSVSDGEYLVRFETNTPDKLYGIGSLFVRNNAEVSQQDFFNGALDTVANVTLVATTTTNTDMRGTDGANTVVPDNAGIASNGSAIAALNNISAADVKAQADQALTDYSGPTLAQMTAAFNEIKGAGFTNETLKYIADNMNTGGGTNPADIYTYFTDSSQEDAFKADLSTLNDLSASQVRAEIERNGGMLDVLPTLSEMVQSSLAKESNVTGAIQAITSEINSLNDISATEVKAEADQALADYDAPTKAELDSAETTIKRR